MQLIDNQILMKKQDKLPKKFKDKWVKALVSGKYKQGSGMLQSNGETYCCLGVACAIQRVKTEGYALIDQSLDKRGKIPNILYDKNPSKVDMLLADINDEGVPFEVIAGVIDQWL